VVLLSVVCLLAHTTCRGAALRVGPAVQAGRACGRSSNHGISCAICILRDHAQTQPSLPSLVMLLVTAQAAPTVGTAGPASVGIELYL
jgi:hypothetical protein